jgi:hypothetical protein
MQGAAMKTEDLQQYENYLATHPRLKALPADVLFAHLCILRGTHPLADPISDGEDVLGKHWIPLNEAKAVGLVFSDTQPVVVG